MKSFTSKSSKATGRESPLRSSAIKEREYTSNLSAQNQQRLYRLAERLENIKGTTTEDKSGKITILEEKFKLIEKFVDENQEEFTRKLHSLKDAASNVEKKLEEERDEYETVIEANIREIDTLDEKLVSLYEIERQRRKETENKIQALFEERFNQLRAELSKENEEMSNSIANITQVYQADLESIKTNLHEEVVAREEADTKNINEVADEIKKLDELAAELKSARESIEQKAVLHLKEVSDKISLTIDDQRKIREQSQAKMIDLLEEACKHLKGYDGDY